MKLSWKYKFPKIEETLPIVGTTHPPRRQRMEEVEAEEDAVDWTALDGDLWEVVAEHLGLQALTLRRTCKTLLHALAKLPRATEIAHGLIMKGHTKRDLEHDSLSSMPVMPCNGHLVCLLTELPFFEFFKVLDVLDEEYLTLRHWKCFGFQLIGRCHELRVAMEVRELDLRRCPLQDKEDQVLTESQLVETMRRYLGLNAFGLNAFRPNQIIVLESGPANELSDWTSTWHLAAEKGMLKVLQFLVDECRGLQPLHTRTPGGNNAYAHAHRALQRIQDDPDLPAADKARERIKYELVLSYLSRIGLSARTWRNESDAPEEYSASDEDSDDANNELVETSDEEMSEYAESEGSFHYWDEDRYA